MASIRVNYTISKNAKDNTDILKKQLKMNISDIINTIFQFDDKSLQKIFELYKLFNKNEINTEKGVVTPEGSFVWDSLLQSKIKKMNLYKLDEKQLDIAATKIMSTINETGESQYADEIIWKQANNTKAIANLINNLNVLEKKVSILEHKLEQQTIKST